MRIKVLTPLIAFLFLLTVSCERGKVERTSPKSSDAIDQLAVTPNLQVGRIVDGVFSFTIQTSEMLETFCSVSGLTASELALFAHNSSEIELLFVLSDASGIGIPLVIEGDAVVMYGVNTMADRHTCSGDPCASCRFIRKRGLINIGLGEIIGCACNQETVDGVKQKCNHSVSTDLGFEDEDSEPGFVAALIAEYSK
ncbi:hypothetical protein [Phaeocystidibacter luteus]|uniref:Uncharacterized protein n=1 Tax=Phaeocystidibacter luteus TaxID=911197 RepID=A0A6N6REM5_9FLAO|nr:hypothetical protein [Phaeocystidibacter luteus]KAB2808610.1 hypothetical protein F8C67_10000 [Phaeocystidibacter luteus]